MFIYTDSAQAMVGKTFGSLAYIKKGTSNRTKSQMIIHYEALTEKDFHRMYWWGSKND